MLDGAEQLETMIVPAVRRFNISRVDQVLERRDDTEDIETTSEGMQTVIEGRRLLRPLFEATEFNIISARQKSGLDPWGEAPGPSQDILIPSSFFLNVGLIAGGGPAGYNGLKITEAKQFSDVTVSAAEYKELIDTLEIRFNRKQGRDAVFAWFMPEPSHIDNDLTDRLLRRGIITPHFLAAVLAVDLETPLYLSKERAALLEFVPDRFSFRPVKPGDDPTKLNHDSESDELTRLVIKRIEAVLEDKRSSMTKDLMTLLKEPDARVVLREKTRSYLERIESGLKNPSSRKKQLQALFRKAIEIRSKVLHHPVLGRLDETDGQLLLPLP